MNLSGLFGSYPGMYGAQSFFHLLVSATIVGGAIRVWKISDPVITQRFHFLVILFPIFSFPLYQLANPQRGSIFFRQEALFDSNRWLHIALWGKVSLGIFFLFILFFTSMIFLVQELLPVLHHTLESRRERTDEVEFCDNSAVVSALADLPGDKPEMLVLDDDENIIFSTTGRKAAVYLSSGLVNTLSEEQIQAAVAHELAHIERSRRPMLFVVFLLRIIMFFNPLVLLEFRRATQDEEKICDDMAVTLTGKPHALAETLRILYGEAKEDGKSPEIAGVADLRDSLEKYSHFIHIQSRIDRLEESPANERGGAWGIFSLVLVTIVIINYFVV
jgi:Zn-dependent protease with chaperone function